MNGVQFNFSFAYHPQTNGKTEVVNLTIEMYLLCFTSSKLGDWFRWLPWVEFCYNTSYHSSFRCTPFQVVYGKQPPTLLTYMSSTTKMTAVEQLLVDRDVTVKEAQARMEVYDQHHQEREF